MADTAIEWADAVWNPLAGCNEVSPGCLHCYAAVMAHRLAAMGQEKYQGTTKKLPNGKVVWTGKLNLDPGALAQPLSWKKPRRVFVNSMSDLFHEDAPDEFIDQVFAVMALCPRHTFQVLTKRPERMLAYFSAKTACRWIPGDEVTAEPRERVIELRINGLLSKAPDAYKISSEVGSARRWPLPNVWLGVSVEDQQRADERIPLLLQTPAAVRFLSCEPLLGPVDLRPKAPDAYAILGKFYGTGTFDPSGMSPAADRVLNCFPKIDWVIAGSESGHNARPCELSWVRSLRDQCVAAGVPFFWKQHVENGRKISLPELDGKRWAEFPEVQKTS
jgi:protein gp37